jgi:spore coat protein U-like protein
MTEWAKRSKALFVLAVAAAAILGPTATAGTATGAFVVQTTITADCTFTTSTLSFSYPSASPVPVRASTTFSIDCPAASPSSPQSVYFTFAPTGGNYQLKQGTSTLNYELCVDPTCAYPYPPNSGQASGTTLSLTTSPYSYVLYGEIPAGQGVASGSYSQNVTVTLNF